MTIRDTSAPPDWKRLYHRAVMELDPTQIVGRIADARNAILNRIEETIRKPGEYNERQALSDALNGLRVLRQEQEQRASALAPPQEKTG
jgi:hypothetical protein